MSFGFFPEYNSRPPGRRKKTLEEKKEYNRKYHEDNRDGIRARKRKYYEEHRDEIREYDLKRLYDITPEEYEKMLKGQRNCCVICGKKDSAKSSVGKTVLLSVDHCHRTGSVRGLLCRGCNIGLGSFEDNIERMLKAIEYINKHKEI